MITDFQKIFKNKKAYLEAIYMLFNKKNKQAEEISEPIRKIIDGKLFDTSKATHICDLCLWWEKIPDYCQRMYHAFGEDVSLYKGNTEYFLVAYGNILQVTEEWVKSILGQYKTEKYIELFGEPELA